MLDRGQDPKERRGGGAGGRWRRPTPQRLRGEGVGQGG